MQTIYYNGKIINKKDLPKDAVKVRTVNEVYYENSEYKKQQDESATNYFRRQREFREELKQRHG